MNLADMYVGAEEFNPWNLDHVRTVAPYDLAPAIQRLLECEGASLEEYKEARELLLKACRERWLEI